MFEFSDETRAPEGGILHLPAVDPHEVEEVGEQLLKMAHDLPRVTVTVPDRYVGSVQAASPHAEAFALAVPLLESLLDDDPDTVPGALLAQLIFMSQFPALPEAIALQVAFGRFVGEQNVRRLARLVTRARRRGLSVDEYVVRLGAADAVPSDTLTRLFRGEARRAPDATRIRCGIALLRRTASLAPPPSRSHLLCAIGWLHWARGQRAIAAAYLAEASRLEPGHILAYGLRAHITSSQGPAWLAVTAGREAGKDRNLSRGGCGAP